MSFWCSAPGVSPRTQVHGAWRVEGVGLDQPESRRAPDIADPFVAATMVGSSAVMTHAGGRPVALRRRLSPALPFASWPYHRRTMVSPEHPRMSAVVLARIRTPNPPQRRGKEGLAQPLGARLSPNLKESGVRPLRSRPRPYSSGALAPILPMVQAVRTVSSRSDRPKTTGTGCRCRWRVVSSPRATRSRVFNFAASADEHKTGRSGDVDGKQHGPANGSGAR